VKKVLKTYKAAKLSSTAVWVLGVTSLASLVGAGPARASLGCANPVTAPGGTLASPTVIPEGCDLSEIDGDQAFPTYWEFTWNSAKTINAAVTQGAVPVGGGSVTGSFYGNLALYDSNDNPIESAAFLTTSTAGSLAGETDASMSPSLTVGSQYILGIEPTLATTGQLSTTAQDGPPFVISFVPAPEPASLGIFGGALAALGFLRKRLKRAG
jgi:hypothetical protein